MTFDGPSKLATLAIDDPATVSVRWLWSRWVDWYLTGDNSKFAPAMAQVGGQDIDPSAGTSIPIYVFLLNGWKVRPKEGHHTLTIDDGILLVDGGGDPIANTVGSYNVRINYQQPVQAITVATGGSSGPSADAVAAAVWDKPAAAHQAAGTFGAVAQQPDVDLLNLADGVEPNITLKQALRILLAIGYGKASGSGTNTIRFRDPADTVDRVTMTVDVSSNRTGATHNA